MNFRSICTSALAVAAIASTGCSKPKPLELAEGCQPLLNGYDCFLPYPSDYHRVADPTLPSGFRIETKGPARLVNAGLNSDVNTGHPIDGYSQVPLVMTAFPVQVSPDGFVKLNDSPDDSLAAASSNTVWLEAATGERIPHWVDLDPRTTDYTRQAIVLHPLVGLKPKTRYVIGFHHVKTIEGGTLAVPEGFRRLRDREAEGDPSLQSMLKRFDDGVFPQLEAAGFGRKELQMAWDFTTGSEEQVTQDLFRVRGLTLAWLATQTPEITITSIETNGNNDVWRKIYGTISGPLFMDQAAAPSKPMRDAEGQIIQNGTTTFPFVALVPTSVRDQFDPGQPGVYGHGFFGGLPEVSGVSSRGIANKLKRVTWGAEWWGMSVPDVGILVENLTNRPFDVMSFVDRVHQGMANWLVLTHTIQHGMREVEAFKRPTSGEGVSVDGSGNSNASQTVYANVAPNYLGISQGHILGGTLGAINPDFSRVILNCGGAGFTQMMMRASPFAGYLIFLEYSIKDPLEQQKYIATLQRAFDRIDPATYAHFVLSDKLPGSSPDRRVLLQNGLGDAEVPNLGSYLHARLLNIPVLTPSPVLPYGLETVASPYAGSAMALYDFGIDTAALYRDAIPPPDPNPVHEGVRKLPSAIGQMGQFFFDGTAVNICSGVCDPE